MDTHILDTSQEQVQRGKRQGVTLGVIGMILGIVGGVIFIFTIQFYFLGGWILAFVPMLFAIAGLVLSIVGKVTSARAGYGNGMALAGIIASPLAMVVCGLMLYGTYSLVESLEVLQNVYDSESQESWEKALEDMEEEETDDWDNY